MRRSRQAVLAAVLGLAAVAFVPVPVLTPGAPAAAQADGSGSFTATFDTPSDFYDRFDTYAGNYTEDNCFETRCRQEGNGINPTEWPGDHDHSTTATGTCTPPTSTRTVAPTPHSQMFYWCAPGGPATGHVMTSIDTSQYAIIAFSPKQSFTDVSRVCVDLNRTDLGGGKWANIAIVPEATFLKYPNPNPNRVSDGEGPYRLDYVSPAFSEANGVGSFSVQDIGDVFSVKYFRSLVDINRGFDIVGRTDDYFIGNDDKATRYQHCVVENADNTVTASRLGPNGTTSLTVPGQLPSGKVRVIFEDDTYDSIKHDGRPQFKTWHWDNVTIT